MCYPHIYICTLLRCEEKVNRNPVLIQKISVMRGIYVCACTRTRARTRTRTRIHTHTHAHARAHALCLCVCLFLIPVCQRGCFFSVMYVFIVCFFMLMTSPLLNCFSSQMLQALESGCVRPLKDSCLPFVHRYFTARPCAVSLLLLLLRKVCSPL